MTRAELEQLLSAYMDGELSPQEMKKAEALVKTNAQAKSILDGYLSVRKAIQQEAKAAQYKVPAGFAARVLAATVQSPQAFESTRYTEHIQEGVSRWKNPRIFAYPLVVLVCALLINVFYRTDTSNTIPPVAIERSDEPVIYAPLSEGAGTVSRPEIVALPEKTELTLVCRVENTASVSTLFTRVFAKYEVLWTRSTTGADATVYEISVTPETLREILEEFRANSMEIVGDIKDLVVEEPVKVFFQVE